MKTQGVFSVGERSACVSCLWRWQETDHNSRHAKNHTLQTTGTRKDYFLVEQRQDQIWFWGESLCWRCDRSCLTVIF